MPYETATVQHETFFRHKARLTGFAEVHLRVTPIEEPTLQFNSEVTPTDLPEELVQACFAGIQERAQSGVIVGHPVQGIAVTLLKVKYCSDSTEEAFKCAASMCFRSAFQGTAPVVKDD